MEAVLLTSIYSLSISLHEEYPDPPEEEEYMYLLCTCLLTAIVLSVTICGSMVTGNARFSALIQSALAMTAKIYFPSTSGSNSKYTSSLLSPFASYMNGDGIVASVFVRVSPFPFTVSVYNSRLSLSSETRSFSPCVFKAKRYLYSSAFSFTIIFSLILFPDKLYSMSVSLSAFS